MPDEEADILHLKLTFCCLSGWLASCECWTMDTLEREEQFGSFQSLFSVFLFWYVKLINKLNNLQVSGRKKWDHAFL